MSQTMYYVPLKSTGAAYLWWLFLGGVGAHKFYLGRPGMGVLYLLTFGLLWMGLLWDLFTLPSQVRAANDRLMSGDDNRKSSTMFNQSNHFETSSRDFSRAEELIARAKQEMTNRPAAPAVQGFGRRTTSY